MDDPVLSRPLQWLSTALPTCSDTTSVEYLNSKDKLLILDFSSVLFTYTKPSRTAVSEMFNKMFDMRAWDDFQCDKISRSSFYTQLAQELGVDISDLKEAMKHAASTIWANKKLFDLASELKEKSDGKIKVVAMSNISTADYQLLRGTCSEPEQWNVFDGTFLSSNIGVRKPGLNFFFHVLAEMGISPSSVIFVDDQLDNIESARSLGINSVLFQNNSSFVHCQIRKFLADPTLKAKEWLVKNAGRLLSVTATGVTLRDNFAQLLILELMKDRSLVHVTEHPGPWNYFVDAPVLTTATYLDDMDTTSYALITLDLGKENADAIMDQMLKYVNEHGIIQVHFDCDRNHIDPVVCINALRLFQKYGRQHEPGNTFSYVLSLLTSNEYMAGTRYYLSPDSFLYFLSYLFLEPQQHSHEGDLKLEIDLAGPLRKALEMHIGQTGDSVELAERVIACHNVGIQNFDDLETLMSMQEEDGGWKPGCMYGYGSTGERIVNKGLTTALALKAIEGAGLLYKL